MKRVQFFLLFSICSLLSGGWLNVRCWMLLDAWYWWDPGLGGSFLFSSLFFSSTPGLAGFALVFFPVTDVFRVTGACLKS